MPKRSLPTSAATALEIICANGVREIHANDLELRMHQRGFDSRACGQALKAFERRNWLLQSGSTIEVSEAAIAAAPVAQKKSIVSRRYRHMPRGLFGS